MRDLVINTRINPNFEKELQEFGKGNWNECFHCGNCTAICPLSEDGFLFPRNSIRTLQMGLKKKLDTSVEPWLCYYCGDCSETCPRDANPGELMMTLRRYLTTRYDWTGLSKKFYTSAIWEYAAIVIIAIAVIVSFLIFLPLRPDAAAMVNESGGVMINSLVAGISPERFVTLIEYGDWLMAAIVGGLLITNIFNMYNKVILSDKSVKVSFSSYLYEGWQLIYNFATQASFSKCEKRSYWLGHLLLMTGYTIMFIIVVVFLPYFQVEEVLPVWHWQRLLGYYATFGILFFLGVVTIQRIRKNPIAMKFSHASDWIFIVMLGLTTITGIILHIFRLTGMVEATYYTYIIHLAVLVPMIVIEVPFSKWSHLAYRPFAIYFSKLKLAALKQRSAKQLAPAM